MAQEQESLVEGAEAPRRGTCFISTPAGPIVKECVTKGKCEELAFDAGGEVKDWVEDPDCE